MKILRIRKVDIPLYALALALAAMAYAMISTRRWMDDEWIRVRGEWG